VSAEQHRLEHLLQEALAPVDPPAGFSVRLEDALSSITEAAAEELEGWELSAMRDPRNWGRPAAALLIGVGAAAGLAAVRVHRRQQEEKARHRSPYTRLVAGADQALRELRAEAAKVIGRGGG